MTPKINVRLYSAIRTVTGLVTFFLILLPLQAFAQRDLIRYVDPFIGTGGHGHTFPGALVPFGMVQLSPDTRLTGWDGCSGYHYSDNVIYGFTHTHLSGTGISDYGDILLMPTVGEVYFKANGEHPEHGYASRFDHKNETARPGYYSVRLDDDNLLVELTATQRVGFHRYTYPTTGRANIIIDLTHRDKVIDSGVKVTSDRTIVGWRRSTGWAKDQIVYFAIEFSQPFTSSGISINEQAANNLHEATGTNLKLFVRFATQSNEPILTKVGISATGVEGALKNLIAEIPGWNFDAIRDQTASSWNKELNKISVTGGTEAHLVNFYTAFYHTMTAPNLFMDVDGKYLGHDRKIHQTSDFKNYSVFSLWDTFRAAHPLYTIIDQNRTNDFIQTFLAQYEQSGRLPVWELAANETDTMIGYHAVSLIADAAVKGIRRYDLNNAFEAMKHSAELKHYGLEAYVNHGYIGLEEDRESVSKTLEYAYDDWCIAQVAQLLGKRADYERYMARAQYYKNVFDTRTGFMRPRSNGNWLTPFEPREVNFSYTEANSWQYTFFVPQDVTGLIELMGGRRKFADKLDQLFAETTDTTGRDQADITGLIGQYAHGNEPSHHMAYLYNYVGEPWKTQARVHEIRNRFYRPAPDGLIGNEDCGQMSAWYVLSAAGFYPVTPGSKVYALTAPMFPEVRFNLENGKSFVIKAPLVSETNIYIQSARLNGKVYLKSYLTHDDVMAGGELVFQMGPRPDLRWGVGAGNEPLSQIDSRGIVSNPVIVAASKTFKDRLSIDLQKTSSESLRLYYTTDGSDPTRQSILFSKPFFIHESRTIKVRAFGREGRSSFVTTAQFQRIPHDWTIQLQSQYSSQYTGGGDSALIDGIRGTVNWSGGGWQGYQGKDLVAVIDLGAVRSITKLGAGFLQDVGSWIWMPQRVDFEISTDGRNFAPALAVPSNVPDGRVPGNGSGVRMKDFVGTVSARARYVRIKAVNYGKIPEWHPGSGGDAWIFADEIIIE